MTELLCTRVETPLGEFVVAECDGTLRRAWFAGQKHEPDFDGQGVTAADTPLLREAHRQVEAYFAGLLREFRLPLAPDGTAFQRAVWQALGRVSFGHTISYGELAHRIARGDAFHAVGAAVARNPLMLLCPCHRVLGSDGSLTGYAAGLERKRWLLDHESGTRRLFA